MLTVKRLSLADAQLILDGCQKKAVEVGTPKDMAVVDAKSFRLNLNTPTGLVLGGLGKPSSAAPFMMPKRVAETDPFQQIGDYTGSGPFILLKDEWKPGDRSV